MGIEIDMDESLAQHFERLREEKKRKEFIKLQTGLYGEHPEAQSAELRVQWQLESSSTNGDVTVNLF